MKISTKEIEDLLINLRATRDLIKQLKITEEECIQKLYNYMGEEDTLATEDGEQLLTWKYTKDVKYFDAQKLKKELPIIYTEYMNERPGSRRLVIL